MKKTHLTWVCTIFALSILAAPILQMSYAHQRALFNINGKDYLFEIGSTTEPLTVDDKNQVYFRAVSPNATDPTNDEANGTKPITGLENTLKAEVIAGNKNLTMDLEAGEEAGDYQSETFFPTVLTTYDYRIFGDINGTAFDVTFTCRPAGGEAAPSDNSTIQISEGVERKALQGGFGCPSERIGFPEPYVSQYEISQELNRTSN